MKNKLILLVCFSSVFLGIGALSLTAQQPNKQPSEQGDGIGEEGHPNQKPVAVEEAKPGRESKVDKMTVPKGKLDDIPFEKLSKDFNEMTNKFGKIDYQNLSYSFDSAAAASAGYDQELIKLAEELVEHQTKRGQDSKKGIAIFGNPDYSPSPDRHPRLIRFLQRMSEQSNINKDKRLTEALFNALLS